jgi:hypothetical protein
MYALGYFVSLGAIVDSIIERKSIKDLETMDSDIIGFDHNMLCRKALLCASIVDTDLFNGTLHLPTA